MRWRWAGAVLIVLFALARPSAAQYESPIESLVIGASQAYTWVDGQTSIILLEGPVSITADRHRMTAQQAVVWVTPVRRAVLDQDRVEIALIGEAKLTQPNGITRSGPRLYVDANVRGAIRLNAPRVGGERKDSELYRLAESMRPRLLSGGQATGQWIVEQEAGAPTTQPTTRPTAPVLRPVMLSAESFRTAYTPEGTVAAVLSGNVSLLQKSARGETIELLADRAVIFTPFQSLLNIPPAQQIKTIEQAVSGAYLEGDVRIIRTPPDPASEPEQRLTANRAFYDFTTDRAVLTDVVLYTHDLQAGIPLVVRARVLRQLSSSPNMQEYQAEKARLTSSTFHTPSFSIGASSAYIRQTDTGSELYGTRTTFVANNATFNAGNLPIFYLPVVGGTVTERTALYGVRISNSRAFGFGLATEWGLFESLGRLPPKDLEASYHIDYYSKRGPATGFDARYAGGFIEERSLEPWAFTGDFTSYLVYDGGEDVLGRRRLDVDREEDELRGRFYWRHQHFFPGDWQVQLTGGYVSDASFMEEWFSRDFRESPPLQTSLYLKRQRDTEAITFLSSFQPNDFVTVADLYQEQFEVERPFEFGYRRIGDSILGDSLTFFSQNTVSALQFKRSDADLIDDLGLVYSPGLPSLGTPYDLTHDSAAGAVPDDLVYRADFRQELDWPFSIGKFRAVPYIVGRYTPYSEGVDGSYIEQATAAAGLRLGTSLWKVDDRVRSELFDLSRLRHVIEPSLHLYAAAQSQDRIDLLIYDEPIDAVTDITAMQVALNQRWQTKRGGPGAWRSVDFFSLNVAWNYFFSQPPDRELNPTNFRGLFFVSTPEASIPRNSVNLDANWLVSDAVRVFGDSGINTESGDLATASVGMSVVQDPRLSYYFALRHIAELDLLDDAGNQVDTLTVNGTPFVFEKQDLLIFATDYALTAKYRLHFAGSYDFAQSRVHRALLGLTRKFDRFFVSVAMRVDRVDDEDSALTINIWPEGLSPATGTQALQGYYSGERRQ